MRSASAVFLFGRAPRPQKKQRSSLSGFPLNSEARIALRSTRPVVETICRFDLGHRTLIAGIDSAPGCAKLANMCNLYTNKSTVEEMADLFKANAPIGINAPADVYPGYPGIVVREQDGERILQSMTWGFPRHTVNKRAGKPNKPQPVNNLRDDKLWTFWRKQFVEPSQRCLIPFTAFAEAEGEKGKMTRTWISVANQPIAAWAGLWKPTDEWGDAYSGVMVDATQELWHIHNRMPVILRPEDYDRWLRGSAGEAIELVAKYPAGQLAVDRTADLWFAYRSSSPSD